MLLTSLLVFWPSSSHQQGTHINMSCVPSFFLYLPSSFSLSLGLNDFVAPFPGQPLRKDANTHRRGSRKGPFLRPWGWLCLDSGISQGRWVCGSTSLPSSGWGSRSPESPGTVPGGRCCWKPPLVPQPGLCSYTGSVCWWAEGPRLRAASAPVWTVRPDSQYFFFNLYILLYNTVLVLPYIDLNPPWVYTCSLPEPPSHLSPSHPPWCLSW